MSPFGRLVTTCVALVTGTALLTGVTTAYMMRPAAAASEPSTAAFATPPVPAVPYQRVAPPAVRSTVDTPRPIRVAARTTTTDCATGSDRAWNIAKPGVLGGLVGAGLGAAGGAIANGGKAAGKGALIGGLAGVAAGAGYGAYKTRNECGTIFGGPR
jgi:hypothetical protein